ncbi:hypothetical protein C8R47DRAFT_1214761 [Mycena vitilis]|nr:hypothetical protein C8R47DRAFT_1214761 [Mycena vitilis]
MARRRPPSNPNGFNNMNNDSPKLPKAQRHRPQQSVEQPNLGMSPEARYNHNLKVLRRRDPSIISIFDQFSHVCVYHHDGQTWEKNGFEGSMFLYESDSYPPYGFYILNRMGKDDYIQRLYPEDVSGPHGTYLMLRSYPDFTSRRMSQVLSSHNERPGKLSDAWSIPDLDKLPVADKGHSHTVGLWMYPTDAREPMIDVMLRLHSYVKKNVPYPEQFRYGPNRPPPPNPHLRTTSPSPPPDPNAAASGDDVLDRAFPSGSASELDKLFARMRTDPSPAPPPAFPSPIPARSVTVASLFAAVTGAEEPAPRSGIALLDSIFASAQAAPAEPLPIHSPTPTTSVLPPQILNHEVITTLLGLPPSRSASVSSDALSHTSSQEGDNEYEGNRNTGSDSFSESSTVLDVDAELDEELQAAGASAGRPLLSVPAPRLDARSLTVNGAGGARVNGRGRVHGDMTPRALPTALGSNDPRSATVPPPTSEFSGSTSTIRPQSHQPQPRHSSAPFVTNSELWPGARAPVDDTADDPLDDGEIVELDFEDTSALSDPDAFREVQQRRARRNHVADSSDGPESGSAAGGRERRDRGKGRKKGKRERAAERAAEIEHQRSLEATRLFQMLDSSNRMGLARASSSSSRSASASPPAEHPPPGLAPPTFAEMESPTTVRPSRVQAGVNGSGPSRMNGPVTGLDRTRAQASVIDIVTGKAASLPPMKRTEFVRELLTLIHTDAAFVDALWQDYMTRTD